jgi:cell fate regulator YaaT (PSP1 superfamily)
MPIVPLPVFEAEADPRTRAGRTDEEIYAALEVPKTLVVKFGAMKLVAEYRYDGDVKPGCGTKLVARTHRGTELVEMLTTTCENAGCSKSVTRQEMLEYIENSGGKDFPFHTNGRVLRVATIDELNRQRELDARKFEQVKFIKQMVFDRKLPMKVVDVEPILGEEVLTVYYMSEDRVDFRDLVRDLAAHFSTRIEMRQVGARDEARLVADYERCGQHCCCKNFLKVLKPISMRAAKMQKATLDPLKISGRCGRLMCCLRYEDQTYQQLKKNLPHRKTRVGTSEGPGIVLDSKILAQLVLVQLEGSGREIAVPLEELMDPEKCPKPGTVAPRSSRFGEAAAGEFDGASTGGGDGDATDDPFRGLSADEVEQRTDDGRREQRERGESRDTRGRGPRGRDPRGRDRRGPQQGGAQRGDGQRGGSGDPRQRGPRDAQPGGERRDPRGRGPRHEQQDRYRQQSERLEGGPDPRTFDPDTADGAGNDSPNVPEAGDASGSTPPSAPPSSRPPTPTSTGDGGGGPEGERSRPGRGRRRRRRGGRGRGRGQGGPGGGGPPGNPPGGE